MIGYNISANRSETISIWEFLTEAFAYCCRHYNTKVNEFSVFLFFFYKSFSRSQDSNFVIRLYFSFSLSTKLDDVKKSRRIRLETNEKSAKKLLRNTRKKEKLKVNETRSRRMPGILRLGVTLELMSTRMASFLCVILVPLRLPRKCEFKECIRPIKLTINRRPTDVLPITRYPFDVFLSSAKL